MTSASTTIRSPTRSNDVSDFIRQLDARGPPRTGRGMRENGIAVQRGQFEHLPHGRVMSHDICASDRALRSDLDIEQTYPLVRVQLANPVPAQWLQARRGTIDRGAHDDDRR